MKERQDLFNNGVASREQFSHQHIKEVQEGVILAFDNFFIEKGYKRVAPEPILPLNDNSVLFTNSTIIPLKSLVEERKIPKPGCFVIQPCLRNQNLQIIYEDKVIPEYMSYFTMVGILAIPSRYDRVAEESWELLTRCLNIPRENIKILISSQDKEALHVWQNISGGPIVEIDSRRESYYEWSYGMPGISGRGLTFSIKFKDSEVFRDIGNIVTMRASNGEMVGCEFGFGVETIISRMLNLTRPIEAATISKVIPFEEGLKEKLADAIACTVVLFRHGLRPGRGGVCHILKAYIKGISYFRRRLSIGMNNIKRIVFDYEQTEFGNSSDISDRIVEDLAAFESKLELFKNYVRSQFTAHTKKGGVNPQFFTKLRKQAKQYGLPPVECEGIVKKLISGCYLES